MRFSDYSTAHRARDIFRRIALKVINEERPLHRYAYVVNIDRANRKCEVQYPNESTTAIVVMGAVQPAFGGTIDAFDGQVVRVGGIRGDRYIEDVMGEAVFVGTLA